MAKFKRKKLSDLCQKGTGIVQYSVGMHPNPMNENDPEKAYASLQYQGTVVVDQLAAHICEHNSVYSEGTVVGVITEMVKCILEFIKDGYKVQVGQLGTFKLSIQSKGAETLEGFNPATNIIDAYVEYEPGGRFVDLAGTITFEQVVNRTIQTAAQKAYKAGRITKEQLKLIKKGELVLGAVVPEAEEDDNNG